MICRRWVAVGSLLMLGAIAGAARADDADVIRQSADAFVAAFNKGDAKAVAALWTEKGVLVDEAGRTYNGRPAIEAAYAELFKAHPGVKINVKPTGVRTLVGDSLLEEGTVTLDPAPSGAADGTRYSAVHVNQDGQWLMSSVRELPAESAAAKALQDLDWLVGSWIAEEHGAKSEVDCRWLANNSYLERTYKVTAADGTTTSGVQIIGVNPRTGQIVSWGFESDGGHTVGAWVPRSGGWGIDAAGIRPDGTETGAMNLLTRVDDNAYSWQSVARTVAGQPRPDTDEIILKRINVNDSKKN